MTAWAELWPDFAIQRIPCAERASAHGLIARNNHKTVIFVNGCFWHKHDCPRFVWPSSNTGYWIPKIQRNVERDKANQAALSAMGWNVIVVWECELKKKVLKDTMERVEKEILGNLPPKYNERDKSSSHKETTS